MRIFLREQEIPSHAISLEEGCEYRLVFSPTDAPVRVLWGLKELSWSPSQGGFLLQTHFVAGINTIGIIFADREERFTVEIKPNPNKLSPSAWATMLEEIERSLPGGAVGISHGNQGNIGTEGTLLPMLSAALLPLIPAFITAVESIIRNPRVQTIQQPEEVRLHTVRHADRETLRWVARHPTITAALDAWNVARLGHSDPFIPQLHSHETNAHPANSYILWLMVRLENSFQTLTERLRKSSARVDTTPEAKEWCQLRAAALETYTTKLSQLQRRSFFRGMEAKPPSEAALLVVQDEPSYARAHALARRLLSPKFQLPEQQEELPAPLKPTYSLYELWAFLAVQQELQKNLSGYTWTWSKDAAERLLFGTGHGISVKASNGAEELELWFNLTFPSWYAHRGDQARRNKSSSFSSRKGVLWFDSKNALGSLS